MKSTPDERGEIRESIASFVSLLTELRSIFVAEAARRQVTEELLEGAAKRLKSLSRALAIAGAVSGLLAVALLAHSCHMADRMSLVTRSLEETVTLLERVRDESATKQQVQAVQTQVAEVKAEQPKIEFADAGAGKPAKPTLVVPPSKPRPKASTGVEIPIQLPPGSRIEDAGAGP